MVTQFSQPNSSTATKYTRIHLPLPYLATGIGIALAVFFHLLWPALTLPASLAVGLLGLSIALIGTAVFSHRYWGESQWGLAIVGQMVGIVAAAILFLMAVG